MNADGTMTAIIEAVERGRSGAADEARDRLEGIWKSLGPQGDSLHRCSLAHYLADLYDDPALALTWDLRALDAADSRTDGRAKRFHAELDVAGFFPSLHLNLADDYRRLSSFDTARDHLAAARTNLHLLPDNEYGTQIRTALEEVAEAIDRGDTAPRASAPTGRPA
ncbi:hypothetical protein D5S18_03340 [Nocardia panacis]|uniref:Tetratricopeptide repeat protein n=1 Tax=Nocardia panacis TaxID=2340916 RepID=A0A3A4KIC6_9NOCA|nr:hypothetical protein [Nocardia panacis]RJO79369.1 hypothetical protein D5S18_03340 [Nocardia panacis]